VILVENDVDACDEKGKTECKRKRSGKLIVIRTSVDMLLEGRSAD
jgi:hypothetical protein